LRRVNREPPPLPLDKNFGAATLRLGDITGLTQRLRYFRVGDTDTEEVACGQPRRAGERAIERIDVGAFAAEIVRLKHENVLSKT
jgi:hypothetical protein